MAKYSNFDSFIKAHLGKGVDYDGTAGVQCVDLAKSYLKEVFDINPGAWGDAHCYYDNYNNLPLLKNNFTRIANTSDLIPKKGDIVVWKSSLNSGGWGHIAIADGVGTTSYFYSYDQNWTGKHDPCTRIKHNYNHFAGVLRPKDQTKVTGTKASTLTSPFIANKKYTLTTAVKIRSGAGTTYSQKKRSTLSAADQKNTLNQTLAVLKSGTTITITEIKKISTKEYWGKFSGGWIALMYNGSKYVK